MFALYLDEARAEPTPYNESNDYVAKARDRMDRTFDVIAPHLAQKVVVDVGASPFICSIAPSRRAQRDATVSTLPMTSTLCGRST